MREWARRDPEIEFSKRFHTRHLKLDSCVVNDSAYRIAHLKSQENPGGFGALKHILHSKAVDFHISDGISPIRLSCDEAYGYQILADSPAEYG